jgi:dTDP-4-amino-4,6-dideoxygalactose transaminase
VVQQRIAMASRLTKLLDGLDGVETPSVREGDVHTYWKYCLRIDPERVDGGPVGLASRLRSYDIASAPRYIQKPAFRCQVFAEQRTFGNSRWPFTLARAEAVDYSAERFPGAFEALEKILVLPLNERYEERHVDFVATSLWEAVNPS